MLYILSVFLIFQVPIFVVVGDAVVINTETFSYVDKPREGLHGSQLV